MIDKLDRGELGAELEHALVHAEAILLAVDQATWRLSALRAALIVNTVGGFAAAGGILAVGTGNIARMAASLIAATTIASLAMLSLTLMRMARARIRDISVMVALSRTVRDIFPAVSQDEKWSELRLATTRARMARFPISGKSR